MVKVIDDYFVENNDVCYTAKIDKHKVSIDKKTGIETPISEIIGYYSTLGNAIEGIRADMIAKKMQEKVYTLDEAISNIKSINKRFAELINTEV